MLRIAFMNDQDELSIFPVKDIAEARDERIFLNEFGYRNFLIQGRNFNYDDIMQILSITEVSLVKETFEIEWHSEGKALGRVVKVETIELNFHKALGLLQSGFQFSFKSDNKLKAVKSEGQYETHMYIDSINGKKADSKLINSIFKKASLL